MKWPALQWLSIEAPQEGRLLPSWWKRVAWMAAIWVGSICALLVIAALIRAVLKT